MAAIRLLGNHRVLQKNHTLNLFVHTNLIPLLCQLVVMSKGCVRDSPYCQCLYFASGALARVVNRIADETFAPTGLSPSHAYLLMAVNKSPGFRSGELSSVLQLSPSTITRLVERLQQKGLLETQHEGRLSLLYPTQAGLLLDPQLRKCWQSLGKSIARKLGEEPSRQFTASLVRAADQLESTPV